MTNRKDQFTIKKQLLRYLNATRNSVDDFLQILPRQGYCYGFSLLHAVMRILHKQEWGDAAMEQILAWDGQPSSLMTKIYLPDAADNASITLQEIFERIIHYLVFNQGSRKTYPHANLLQFHFLLPGSQFLLINGRGEKSRIKVNYQMAGHLSVTNIIKSLEDEDTIDTIKNNICLVHSPIHTCELGYQQETWYFFDPNYIDGKARYFCSLEALANEIQRVLGSNIIIEIACFNRPKNKPFRYYYDELFIQHPESLIQDGGLFAFAKVSPHLIPGLIKNLTNTSKLALLNPDQLYSDGSTPLMCVTENRHIAAIKALCAAGANPNQACNSLLPMILAARNNDARMISALHAAGASPNLEVDGWTPLMHAAYYGHTRSIAALCAIGANPDHADLSGWTPLMLAAQNGHADSINALCAAGANTDQAELNGWTALVTASQNNRAAVIQALHSAGASLNSTDSDGWTALMFATDNNHIDAAFTLIEKSANPDAVNSSGYTALMLAAQKGHQRIVEKLLSKQADFTIAAHVYTSDLLAFASQSRQREKLETLLKNEHHGTLPDSIPGFTALHLAVFTGQTETVKLLLGKMSNLKLRILNFLQNLAVAMENLEITELIQLQINASPKKPCRDRFSFQSTGLTLFETTSALPTAPPSDPAILAVISPQLLTSNQ